ncbi:zinc finger BED domain-containing protein 4-like [Mytilus edulis]|uniref:zinc finger BED domain-containing protein 4-like n=1 Tax=Mytilus edulis TaxID=6550 RepID=UPI0039EE82E8
MVKFTDLVLRGNVVPHFDGHPLADRPPYMDDHARPYRARIVTFDKQQESIDSICWPVMSPNMNPIEHVSNATRWNSQLYMLRSILRVPEEKLNAIDCKYKLSSYEKKLLTELCTILDPFGKAFLLVQKEITISGSLTIPVTLGFKHQVHQISVGYSSKMVASLINSIKSRLSQFESDECYILASLLDPRFKVRWCETEEKVDKYVDILKKRVNQKSSSVNVDFEYSSPPCKKVRTEDFFSFMPSTPPTRKRNPSGLVNEVNDYISEPCIEMSENPLMYWQVNSSRVSLLSTLAKKHLAIPATSAPVERLFSIAGKVFRPERCRLNDKTFEQLMMIREVQA